MEDLKKTIRWPDDCTKVDVTRPEELAFWSKRLQVSPAMLRRVVRRVGQRFKDVSYFLTMQRQG